MTDDLYPRQGDPRVPAQTPASGPTFEAPVPQPVAPPQPVERLGYVAPETEYTFGGPTFDPNAYGARPTGQGYGAQFYQAPGYGPAQDGYGVQLAPMTAWYGRPIIDDPTGRDAPARNASLTESYARFWKRGLTFSGRASRNEFWYALLANALVMISGTVISGAAASANLETVSVLTALATVAYAAAAVIPALAVSARRLHDSNNSAWLLCLNAVPYIGSLVLLVMMGLDSRPEGARYDQINRP
ncbi:MAG: DUF805 domain-containing protein [Arachnia sp.]